MTYIISQIEDERLQSSALFSFLCNVALISRYAVAQLYETYRRLGSSRCGNVGESLCISIGDSTTRPVEFAPGVLTL